MRQYDILQGCRKVGTAEVSKEGLYYHFRCYCSLPDDVLYIIKVMCNDKENSLGVCVPICGRFGVDTKIPIKRIGIGELTFFVVPKHVKLEGRFEPIKPDEPFTYIEKLKNARLAFRNGICGVLIAEETQPET